MCKEKEINTLKKELKNKEEKWKEEKNSIERRVRELEKKKEADKSQEDDWRTEMELKIQNTTHGELNEEYRTNLGEIEQRLEIKERKERRHNILIKGVEFNEENLKDGVVAFMNKKLELTERITRATKIRNREDNRGDTMLVELESLDVKIRIMKAKYKLKGTKIYIEDDYTNQERAIQKECRNIAKEITRRGGKARAGYQKIDINGKWTNWKDAIELLRKENFREGHRREEESDQ